ncbi:DNA alkylation repair protein [uncultured Shimia sp.]|uniref:DNA alkylation repair protein n=1 Tax=uncultured Shimia sp. TaxID=573152 RepID=UPI0034179F3A
MKDQLFNVETLSDLAAEYSAAISDFDGAAFHRQVVAGLQGRELMERLDWIADCIEARLPTSFSNMALALEAAMPAELDPSLQDDDFGRFIHAVPGILAVRHGLEAHRDRALDLIHAATKRFSMEFYIRPFLNRWPEETFARLDRWARDENYHVRRLVSEGTRPKLPWAKAITTSPLDVLPLLDRLHADPTRYVTRSVANHLNDIAKINPEAVLERLASWQKAEEQDAKELQWMTRHALRTLVKQGHPGALEMMGYRADADIRVDRFDLGSDHVVIDQSLAFDVTLAGPVGTPVLVDYVLGFHRPSGTEGRKVFKLKQSVIGKDGTLALAKSHRLKGNATTFKLHPGPHKVALQVNGRILAERPFDLVPAD